MREGREGAYLHPTGWWGRNTSRPSGGATAPATSGAAPGPSESRRPPAPFSCRGALASAEDGTPYQIFFYPDWHGGVNAVAAGLPSPYLTCLPPLPSPRPAFVACQLPLLRQPQGGRHPQDRQAQVGSVGGGGRGRDRVLMRAAVCWVPSDELPPSPPISCPHHQPLLPLLQGPADGQLPRVRDRAEGPGRHLLLCRQGGYKGVRVCGGGGCFSFGRGLAHGPGRHFRLISPATRRLARPLHDISTHTPYAPPPPSHLSLSRPTTTWWLCATCRRWAPPRCWCRATS